MSLVSENIQHSPGTFVQDMLREEKMHRILSQVQGNIKHPILPRASYDWLTDIQNEAKGCDASSGELAQRLARIAALAISGMHQYSA